MSRHPFRALAVALFLALLAGHLAGQGYSASVQVGYDRFSDGANASLDDGSGVDLMAGRFWVSGLEVGLGSSFKFHEASVICLADPCEGAIGRTELELFTLFVATRYWFGNPGSETVRIHPFVGARLGYADYVGDGSSSGGVQVGVAGGASYRLAGPLGLMGSVALDGLGFSDRRLGASGRGFFTTRVSVKAGAIVRLP